MSKRTIEVCEECGNEIGTDEKCFSCFCHNQELAHAKREESKRRERVARENASKIFRKLTMRGGEDDA